MPSLAFGLGSSRPTAASSKPTLKRKSLFESEDQQSDDESSSLPTQSRSKETARPLRTLNPLAASSDSDEERPSKSPKLSQPEGSQSDKYTNLSALRNAKIQSQKVAEIDSSVYDYDDVYETFSAPQRLPKSNGEAAGPKYMGNLLASSEQRKRDQLRAKEKALQREREQEGDEFADKEKFVTTGYKKQQEEMRVQEEEEKKRQEEEDEKRKKGLGMTDFNKTLLRRDEERQRAIEEATRRKAEGHQDPDDDVDKEVDENTIAKDLNDKGGHIIVNDEGEVVDKRQLLSAGLNAAPKKPGQTETKPLAKSLPKEASSRSSQARNAREAQRERQTRMMERQLEEMTEKARAAEEAEEKERQAKNQSKITEEAKMDAKARYLARKKEKESQAK